MNNPFEDDPAKDFDDFHWRTRRSYLQHRAEYISVGLSDLQRRGQWAFNLLAINRPDLSEQIRGTTLDPFYLDGRLKDFWLWVKENWEVT